MDLLITHISYRYTFTWVPLSSKTDCKIRIYTIIYEPFIHVFDDIYMYVLFDELRSFNVFPSDNNVVIQILDLAVSFKIKVTT